MPAAITAETNVERELLADRQRRGGLDWDTPRSGHPDVVREALAAHPIVADARAVEARIFRAARCAQITCRPAS
jgi:hypothetical protein